MKYSTLAILMWNSLSAGSYAFVIKETNQQFSSPPTSPTTTPPPLTSPLTSYSLNPVSCSNITSCLKEYGLQIATAWGPLHAPNNDTKRLKEIASSIESLEAKWMSESEQTNLRRAEKIPSSTTKAAVPSCLSHDDADNNKAWCECSYEGSTRTFPTSKLPGGSGRPCPSTAAATLFEPTSSSGPRTVTPGTKYPFTTILDNGEVIACASSTKSLMLSSSAWLCAGSSTTISTFPSPQVTLRMNGTPCNWGSASPTDIYTSISSLLLDACSKSAQPTVVTRTPKPRGTHSWPTYERTMSACSPKTMAIKDITGLESDNKWPLRAVPGEVLMTADRNFFDKDDLELFINASARAVMAAVQKNYVNILLQTNMPTNISDYNVTWSTANSTELNYFDLGYTQSTQSFSVDYQWAGGEGHTTDGDICEYAGEIGDMVVAEIPALEEKTQFALELCDTIKKIDDDS